MYWILSSRKLNLGVTLLRIQFYNQRAEKDMMPIILYDPIPGKVPTKHDLNSYQGEI